MGRIAMLWIGLFVLLSCHRDRVAESDQAPARIVTLTPSATAIVVRLGATERLVGRDSYSTRPPAVAQLPVVGDFVSPNVESIAALHPQLVILDEAQGRTRDALQAVGVPTLSLTMHQVSDVRSGLIEVGHRLGLDERATREADAFDAKLEEMHTRASARLSHPRVLILIDRSPTELSDLIAAGPGSYLDELLTLVGGQNVMSGAPVRYPQLSAEQLMRAAPEIIIDASGAAPSTRGLQEWPILSEVPAVRRRRVHRIVDRDLLSPSPRIGDALDRLWALTGDAPL
jgi:ABC-type Fe3+-hydroxamate transport system substrate-binding protein